MKPFLAVKRLKPSAVVPAYQSEGAAGLDLHACLDAPAVIAPGDGLLIPTAIAVAVPEGFVGLVRDRSSLAVAGMHTVAGVIDSDYRGEVRVAVHNAGRNGIEVRPGDRIAQMLLLPCPQADVAEVASLPPTVRGEGGFGSTGR